MPTADPWVDNSFAPLHSLGDPGHPFTRPPGKAEGSKRRQHPGWTFASHWNYLPTKTSSAGASLSAPQRGCIPLSVCSLNLASPPKMAQCFLLSLTRNPITRNGKQACPEWCLLSSWSPPEDSDQGGDLSRHRETSSTRKRNQLLQDTMNVAVQHGNPQERPFGDIQIKCQFSSRK